jgi:predicted nucleotidyltransferase
MKWPVFTQFDIKARTILLGHVGSISHGTYIPPSQKDSIDDRDVMGVCVPPEDHFLGLQGFEQLDTWVDEYDIVIYNIRKFIKLLLKNNPNVLGTLWLEPNHYIIQTELGKLLVENREIFSSKQCYKSFCGYAHSQLRRMTHFKFEGYMGEKRKALVQKYGYDTKNASHLIRLLRMGMEFLATGELNVMRHDSQQLVAIKQGEYKLEQVQKIAEDLFPKMEEAYIRSSLPNQPDVNAAEKLLIQIVKETNNG